MTRSASRATLAGLALVIVVAGLLRLPSYRVALERDTAQMLYGGQVVLDGGTPYVDAALNKGPATYVAFAAVRAIAGQSAVAVRLALLLAVIAAALALAAYVRRFAGDAGGLLAGAALAALAPLPAMQGDDPNLAQFAIAPMALALALTTRPVAAGAIGAFTVALNPAFAIPLGPALLIVLLWDRDGGAQRRLGLATAGALAVVAAFAVWLLAAGALDDLVRQVPGTWHQEEIAAGPGLFDPRRLVDVPAPGLWLTGLAGALAALRRPALRQPALVALAWIVACWARLKLGDHAAGDAEHPHHAYPLVLGVALGLAVGVASVERARALVAVLVLAVPVTFAVVVPQLDLLGRPVAERGLGGVHWGAAYPIAEQLRRTTRSQDRILVAGSNPEVYWLAGRRAPTRFFDIYPVFARPEYAVERAREVRAHPPKAVVAMAGAPVEPELEALLGERYALSLETPEGRVWTRVD